jgi:3-dehydroquinate dehydratase-2
MQLSPSGPIKVLVIHGPNLNLLGTREPDVYGSVTFYELNELIVQEGKRIGCEVRIEQSNHEGVLLDWVHEAHAMRSAVVINPGAYARTSLALHDAVKAVQVPVIEIHITNTYQRESYRPPSYLSRAALGVICGFGVQVYRYGLIAVADLMEPA